MTGQSAPSSGGERYCVMQLVPLKRADLEYYKKSTKMPSLAVFV